ncbi:NlpC/P60 family protein [Belliella kenyensis]|uniref:NlpC/P60 family protein n=1 Tax=Belliella kenyensis TaxID=1472724 RepID=A0ABV8EIA2_9BACT|nr:SH3 domain-containing C40 family peptidase [Belliella kenyensis]MCH7401190.1 C40 family peptidase [Belliella kenyensis]MDN3604187.1 SH3 domain-containing C40 family peptidase [Belliella kenyensis]
MKKKLSILIFFAFTIISFTACTDPKSSQVSESIESFRMDLAPDKRVALWDIQWDGKVLSGQTDQEEGLEAFLNHLDSLHINYDNQIVLLPAEELGAQTLALVTISVANIRSDSKHSAELATQAVMGTPLKVLKKNGSWYLIQTPEGYISWVDAAGIALKNQEELQAWINAPKVIFTEIVGYVYENADKGDFISDLVAGNILEVKGEKGGFWEVVLPDGRKGWVDKSQCEEMDKWLESRNPSKENLIKTAKSMMGVPYLWGGTSVKGVDCSGFTKTIYYLNGAIIPRDASQQIHEGEEIDTSKGWDDLQVGDLLFFGEKATEGKKERVIHVGMWIGDKAFIHSRGRVRISSFDPESPDYDEYELNRYLRTKRIVGTSNNNIKGVSELLNY